MGVMMIRRTIDVGGRRVHLRMAGDGPPVLLLHESPRSSAAVLPLVAHAPPGLRLIAPDTPGNGHSEPLPPDDPQATDYADALADTMDALAVPRAAVYGTHTGAAIGIALAQRHPQRVAGLVLDGVGVFDAAERAELLSHYLAPFTPAVDGTHLAWLWARVRDQMTFFPWNHRGSGARLALPLPPPEVLHAVATDFLASGDAYRAPYVAAFRYRPAEVLPQLAVPVRVATREDDLLLPHLQRLPGVPVHVLPPRGPAWGAQVWAWLAEAARGLPAAGDVADAALPAQRLGDRWCGDDGARWHWHGATGGPERPIVWFHPSPGGARALPAALRKRVGRGPVLALDLPGHGDTGVNAAPAFEAVAALAELLRREGLADAELQGAGLGAAVAHRVAQALGRRGVPPPPPVPAAATLPELDVRPRADGGHLAAAWFHARDEAILGGWWQRTPAQPHDFGDGLDADAIHRMAVEVLKDTPHAARWRAAWALPDAR